MVGEVDGSGREFWSRFVVETLLRHLNSNLFRALWRQAVMWNMSTSNEDFRISRVRLSFPHLPVSHTFGTKGVVTWYIGNWELGSKYIGIWKMRALIQFLPTKSIPAVFQSPSMEESSLVILSFEEHESEAPNSTKFRGLVAKIAIFCAVLLSVETRKIWHQREFQTPFMYPSSHNHGSGKMGPSNIGFLLFRVTLQTSMIMGERVVDSSISCATKAFSSESASLWCPALGLDHVAEALHDSLPCVLAGKL